MGEVEVIETEYGCGETVFFGERGVEEGDEEGLPGALRGCEADYQGWWEGFGGRMLCCVTLVQVEDEGNHMLGFVILNALWNYGCCHGLCS